MHSWKPAGYLKSRFKLKQFRILLFACVVLIGAGGCTGTGYQNLTDPSGVGLKAFCGVEDALATSKADWAAMTSPESQIEDVLAAADRLERSYALASESLGSVPPSNAVYESARYIKADNEKLSTIFKHFKEAYVYQDQNMVAAAKAEYTTTYNSMVAAYSNGTIPGVNAFNEIVGNTATTCTGISTSYVPADSTTALKNDKNSAVCQSGEDTYSVNQFFVEFISLDFDSMKYSDALSLEPLRGMALKLQPLAAQSSGSLLVGLAKMSSGMLTAHEAASLGNGDALTESLAVVKDGIDLARKSCLEIGIVFQE